MPPALAFLTQRLAPAGSGKRRRLPFWLLAGLHLVALAIVLWSEVDPAAKLAALLFWGLLNFLWLTLVRRPAAAAALSLAIIVTLILLSQFKHDKLLMTVNFLDVIIVDSDTLAFLFTVFPDLTLWVALAAAVVVPAIVLLWWFDPLRVRFRVAALGAVTCLAALGGLALALPSDL
jgi:hypothetical protein